MTRIRTTTMAVFCRLHWYQLAKVTLGGAALLTAGCEFDSTGTGSGPPPMLGCGLDLTSTQFYTDLVPGVTVDGEPAWGGALDPGDPLFGDTFWIGWTVHYFGNPGDPAETSDPFNTHIEILSATDEVVWAADIESDPVTKGDYRTDGIVVEGGIDLPGDYIVSIHLDTEGDVYECFSLPAAVNNFVEYPLTVVSEPIDDVVAPGGEAPAGGAPTRRNLGA